MLLACTNPLGSASSSQSNFLSSVGGALHLTDSDNSSLGFGGGTSAGSAWDTAKGFLRLDQTGLATNLELDPSWTPAWSNIVGYWKLNGTSGSIANNAVIPATIGSNGVFLNANGSTFPTTGYSAGQLNQGINFDGSDDAIAVPNYADIANWDHGITVQFWAKSNSANWSSSDNGFVVKRNSFVLNSTGSGTQLGFYVWNGTSWSELVYTVPVSIQSWHHYVFTCDNSTMKLYLDGQFVASQSGTGAILDDGSSSLYIANDPGGSGRYFNGSMDDVAIWNIPLSAAAVGSIYQHQSAKYAGTFTSRVMDAADSSTWASLAWKPTLPFFKELPDGGVSESASSYSSQSASLMNGIVGLWHLDEVSGTTFVDQSGQNDTGTLSGGVTVGGAGVVGSSVKLNGTSGYILGNKTINTATATVSAWIYISTYPSSSARIVGLAQGNGSGTHDKELYMDSAGKIYFYVFDGNLEYTSSPSAAVPLNKWTHVVGTADGTQASAYMNGAQVGSTTAGSTYTSYNGPNFLIGGSSGFSSMLMSIDEVAMWNRALSTVEITELYRRGANRIKYQVRSCSDATCSASPTWLGPDGSNQTYFSELNNNLIPDDGADLSPSDSVQTGLPTITFSAFGSLNLVPNRYFQYRAIMESDDAGTGCNYGSGPTWCSPELQSVSATIH